MNDSASPKHLLDIIGQEKIKESLKIMIEAARQRGEALDHVLFCGPLGFGKTTLANVVANEMGVEIKVVAGSSILKEVDLASILTSLRAGDVLLIQQIEVLRKPVMEVLYSAMGDFALDIIVGKRSSARSIQLKLSRFTVIGTTSQPSQVNERLKSLMFECVLAPYDDVELGNLIFLFAKQQNVVIHPEAARLLAKYSGGSPSEAHRLLKSVHQYSIVRSNGELTIPVLKDALPVMLHQRNEPVATERQPIPDNVKMFVWQRDQGRCVICGSQENLEFDHIIPLAKGGSNTARNIQLLCEKHNRSQGANLV